MLSIRRLAVCNSQAQSGLCRKLNIITLQQPRNKFDIKKYLESFHFDEKRDLFSDRAAGSTRIEFVQIQDNTFPRFINEFWTSKQRQANPIHEIAYRACFKPQLPRFFIDLLTEQGDAVYDPFSGRGTTVLEAALLGRNIIANDVNPLSQLIAYPRLFVPRIEELEKRVGQIPIDKDARAHIDLSMFYHAATEAEVVSLKKYLLERATSGKQDELDLWIRMVATNRLTGHSAGFFSIYTLPPNQAALPQGQIKINRKRNQRPEYRDTKKIILSKSRSLVKEITEPLRKLLAAIGKRALFLTEDARATNEIESNSVQLTVTSPPFLDVVHYSADNWLRCWFNGIDAHRIEEGLTMSRTIEEWCAVMGDVFKELFRITARGGWVAFEVGEVKGGKIRLDEHVVPLGVTAGFACEGILINEQTFTKTSNIWGIRNNTKGTNTNRVVIFHKGANL